MIGARSVEWSVRRANCKRFTHKRPTDGSGSRPVQLEWGEALNGGAWTDSDAQRSGGFKVFGSLPFIARVFFETKQLNCQLSTASKLSRVKPVGDRLHQQQTHANVKRTGSFRIRPKNMRLTSHCRAEYRAGTPCDSFCFPQRRANHRALDSDALP